MGRKNEGVGRGEGGFPSTISIWKKDRKRKGSEKGERKGPLLTKS